MGIMNKEVSGAPPVGMYSDNKDRIFELRKKSRRMLRTMKKSLSGAFVDKRKRQEDELERERHRFDAVSDSDAASASTASASVSRNSDWDF
mmetsp:Transcript_3033/g.7568  ORF Transcript_3033/g.7568 Transcript_3033/m.7568 type:complete len:91 (+) Transcript_3033:142-414(+)